MTEENKDQDPLEDLIGVLPMFMADAVKAIPDSVHAMHTKDLEEKLGGDQEELLVLKRMRITFWIEADKIFVAPRLQNVKAEHIYAGLCDKRHFVKKIVGNSFKLSYIIRRYPAYEAMLQEIVFAGMEYERRILALPDLCLDRNGNTVPDHKLMALKQRIIDGAHNRLKGTPVARTQIHQHTTTDLPSKNKYDALPDSALEKQIRELKGSK